MSTHYIEEAERLADTVVVVSHGRGTWRSAGRATSSSSTRAARRWRSTGRRRGCARSRPTPRGRGWPTRRTGTSVTILRAEELDGDVPDGERRLANLEDVFVLLTGEEIA